MALTQISTAGVKDDAVTSGKIPANAVGSSELADNAVDTNAIQDDAVTLDKIADSSISLAKMRDNSVGTSEIVDQAVTLNKLPHGDSSSNGKFLRANNGADPTFESLPASGLSNIVEDTSPQLGGNLDIQSNDTVSYTHLTLPTICSV